MRSAVETELEAYRPPSAPPFALVRARAARRRRVRAATMAAFALAAVVGGSAVAVSSGLTKEPSPDALVAASPGPDEPTLYRVDYVDAQAYEATYPSDDVAKCAEFGGVQSFRTEYVRPPVHFIAFAGDWTQRQALEKCLGGIPNTRYMATSSG